MRKVLFLVLTSFLAIGCKDATPKDVSIDNLKVVEKLYEHFNNHNWKAMSELYVENAEFKDPSLGTAIVKQTKKQIEEKYTELNKLFPDINDRVIKMYPSGEKNIIVEFVSTGTGPDKSKFELPICTIFTIENGKITKDFTYYDNFDESK